MTVVDIHPSRLSLGSKVSVITGAQYRYEGTVAAINSIEGTLTLQNVCFWGAENRVAENTVSHSGEKKLPAVGSIFNLITFWMSSIVQVWLSDEDKDDKNDIGDKGIAKAGMPVDMSRGRSRRTRSWWQSGDHSRATMNLNGPANGGENVNHILPPVGRYAENMPHPGIQSQPRMLVSYPRRGRNSAIYPRHTGYVPVVPVVQGPGGMRRSGYSANARSPSYRGMTTPAPSGARMSGRRTGPPMRHMMGAGDEYRYNQAVLNPAGGVLVYLPPDMAAAYQSHGINFVPSRPPRRRVGERRNVSRGPEATEPEIDCTTPYDFEAANAEFKEELEKITINADGVPVTINSQQQSTESNTRSSNSSTTTGDSQTTTLRSPSSIVSAAGNGASGDSTRGGVTGPVDSHTTTADGNGPLAKGEYYVREKCFFDQISRPESGPRSSFSGDNGRTGYGGRGGGYGSTAGGQNRRFGYGSGFNSFTAARRERQLNMETFGSLAARAAFIPRRRGPPPREYLVTAPA